MSSCFHENAKSSYMDAGAEASLSLHFFKWNLREPVKSWFATVKEFQQLQRTLQRVVEEKYSELEGVGRRLEDNLDYRS